MTDLGEFMRDQKNTWFTFRHPASGIPIVSGTGESFIQLAKNFGLHKDIDRSLPRPPKEPKSGETRAGTRFRQSRRNVEPTATPTSAPQSNLPKSTEMGIHRNFKSERSGADATNGDEVQVVPPPKKISKIHPDYFTLMFPHVKASIGDIVVATDCTYANTTPIIQVRLNSIYDPIKSTGSAFDQDQHPQGRDIWSTHFKFYRVLKSRVKITFLSHCMPDNSKSPMYNSFAIGYELVDENHSVSNNAEMFLTTKHAKRGFIGPCMVNDVWNGTAVERRPIGVSSHQILHTYYPDAWDYHVEEKGSEERWTPIGANPAIDHLLAVRCMHMDGGNAPAGKMDVLVQIEYEVQYREATDAFTKTRDTTTATYPDAEGELDD